MWAPLLCLAMTSQEGQLQVHEGVWASPCPYLPGLLSLSHCQLFLPPSYNFSCTLCTYLKHHVFGAAL